MADKDSRRWTQDSVPALLGSNWAHYLDTFKILDEFVSKHSGNKPRSKSKVNRSQSIPLGEIQLAPENMLAPADNYLSLYCDLLGFTAEMKAAGSDSLPDFYGAAYDEAAMHPPVQVYLLSDSLLAFAKANDASRFVDFVARVVLNWRANGLLPQSFIGYGTFVERKPVFGKQPPNFFGVQVAGTALTDAVDIQKKYSKCKPLGSRILVSQSAEEKLPRSQSFHVVWDKQGNLELLPETSDRDYLFDCLYYLLCLRTLKPSSRIFKHYVWSIASRAFKASHFIFDLAVELASSHYADGDITTVADAVEDVLQGYQPAR